MLESRVAVAALVLFALAGCGGGGPAPNPGAFVGQYTVTITANDVTDQDEMSVVVGAGNTVLLTFVYGISEIRASVIGSTALALPRQTLHVDHSTGAADGQAIGQGTLMSGMIEILIHLTTAGFTPPDAGAGGAVDYHITGKKN